MVVMRIEKQTDKTKPFSVKTKLLIVRRKSQTKVTNLLIVFAKSMFVMTVNQWGILE
jgi:hypothetical protein